MSDFPSNKTEALTMLYLQTQNLAGLSPEQLAEKYQETYARIKNAPNENASGTKAFQTDI